MSLHYVLQRRPTYKGATIGALSRKGAQLCYVLEDEIRERPNEPVEAWKVPGKTAVPRGTYQIIVTPSARFRQRLPLLVNVPGFTGIRIHSGNTQDDTEGCLLPGLLITGNTVGRSRDALLNWQAEIEDALLSGEAVTLEIRNP